MPDSATWSRKDALGTFTLSYPNSTSFAVLDTLPSPLGSDTLSFQAWTLSLRTTTGICGADASGNLFFFSTSKDSAAIRLLHKLDSLRHLNSSAWGSRSDVKAIQVAALVKAYATLLWMQDSSVLGFPSRHPVGIDSQAVVNMLLALAAKNGVPASAVASRFGIDSLVLKALVRTLYAKGALTVSDTAALLPSLAVQINHAPGFSGASDFSRTLDTAKAVVVANWIASISAGTGDSGQHVHFEVAADSGLSHFAALPSVDSAGTLRFKGHSVGTGHFRVRAMDDGGHATRADVDTSIWKDFAITLVNRPVLSVTGLPDTLHLVEDSTSEITLVAQNFHGSVLSVEFTPADTALIAAKSWAATPDTNGVFKISLQGKAEANGPSFMGAFKFSDSLDKANGAAYVSIAVRNDAPSFGGASSLVVVSSASPRRFFGWIDSISPGPANESGQKVSFIVQVLSGASLFATTPSVDSIGTLSFTGKANSSGPATIQVRAKDNGDSTGSNMDTSTWKNATLTFNVAPALVLSTHSVSTYESVQASAGTATVSDLETSVNNLALSWKVLDSTVLRHDSIYVGTTGSVRNIQLHPVVGSWGTSRIVFTLTDTLGGAVADTLILAVQAVNHAPTLIMKSPALLATSWKGEQTFALASANWDDASLGQKGRFDLTLSHPSDTAYFSTLRMDSSGALHVLAKIDTSIAVNFRFRAHDSAGTANGGVDTSAWSAVQTLQLVDTVLDADGNSYRAKVLGTQTWMLSNLQRVAGTAACANDSCGKYGRQYTLDQALVNPTQAELYQSTYVTHTPIQGLCPEGWHVPTGGDWDTLKDWAGDSAFCKLRSKDVWTDTTYHLGKGYTRPPTAGTDRYEFGIFATTTKTTADASSGDAEHAMGALFWTSTFNTGSGNLIFAEGFFAPDMITRYKGDGGGFSYIYSTASIRCAKDTTERSYGWISP